MRGSIIEAAKHGDVKQIEQCLSAGAFVDEQSSEGYTALMQAAGNGHKAAVEFLIARKANVNLKNKLGSFPLYYSAWCGYEDICDVLLRNGADRTLTYDGNTAAQWAKYAGHTELAEFISSWQYFVCAPLSS